MRLDRSSFLGIALGMGAILGGLAIEGGRISQLLQPTAALIVFGGTMGAVLLQFPLSHVRDAARALVKLYKEPESGPEHAVAQLVTFANKARQHGIVALDADLDAVQDPFFQRTLMLAIDGTAPQDLRRMIEAELECRMENEERIVQVYESAGGYSPTIGILGAVLGLIQVMQRLQNIDEVGRGIAVAFVATIYGVAAANLFFLPAAGKLRLRQHNEQFVRQLLLEGVICLLEGMNPRVLQIKLSGLIADPAKTVEGR